MLQTQDLLTIKVFEYGARPAAVCERLLQHRQPKLEAMVKAFEIGGPWRAGRGQAVLRYRALWRECRPWRSASGLDRIDADACTANLREMSYAPDESAGHRLPIGAVGNSVQAT
jgi:hypothetical protein